MNIRYNRKETLQPEHILSLFIFNVLGVFFKLIFYNIFSDYMIKKCIIINYIKIYFSKSIIEV